MLNPRAAGCAILNLHGTRERGCRFVGEVGARCEGVWRKQAGDLANGAIAAVPAVVGRGGVEDLVAGEEEDGYVGVGDMELRNGDEG